MKITVISLSLLLIAILIMKVKFQIFKVKGNSIKYYIYLSTLFNIKVDITKVVTKISQRNLIKNNVAMLKIIKNHQILIKNTTNLFDLNRSYFSINTSHYLENINFYLFTFYLYSIFQNIFYTSFNNIFATCFKSGIKNSVFNVEIDFLISTKIYKVLAFTLQNLREITVFYKEVKNEQSSNNRIIENIYGKY